MMASILVTGGPVHAHLDAVKIVTNRFRGGRMIALAKALGELGHEVMYLTAQHLVQKPPWRSMTWASHNGFKEYRRIVKACARESDMVILGAAVANLIPEPPWDVKKKFPSHDYEEGDEVLVPFKVAPRIINEVKKENPRCTLVGFKLLQDVSRDELVRAAHTVINESNASYVVANDASDLMTKHIVTRERSVIPALDLTIGKPERAYLQSIGAPSLRLVDFLNEVAHDKHYSTEVCDEPPRVSAEMMGVALERFERLVEWHRKTIEITGSMGGKLLGCLAVAVGGKGFLISKRAKKTADEHVYVSEVDHKDLRVISHGGKPSLNAPLIDWLLHHRPHTWGVLHHHGWGSHLPTYPYAPPGTMRDSQRSLSSPHMEFAIEHHGVFRLLTEKDMNA